MLKLKSKDSMKKFLLKHDTLNESKLQKVNNYKLSPKDSKNKFRQKIHKNGQRRTKWYSLDKLSR